MSIPACMLAVAAMLAQQIVVGGPQVYAVGGWGAPLGIDRAADGLRAIFLLILHRAWFRTRTAAWPQERIPLQNGRETDWLLLIPPLVTAVATVLAGLFAASAFSPLEWAQLIAAREYLDGVP